MNEHVELETKQLELALKIPIKKLKKIMITSMYDAYRQALLFNSLSLSAHYSALM